MQGGRTSNSFKGDPILNGKVIVTIGVIIMYNILLLLVVIVIVIIVIIVIIVVIIVIVIACIIKFINPLDKVIS